MNVACRSSRLPAGRMITGERDAVFHAYRGCADRVLYAPLRQTRPVQRVDVVDDGSSIGYEHLRSYWEGVHPCETEVRWIRQRNAGKKHAQAVTFTSDPAADIFVTVDSDTALEERAMEEGLKPFASRRVMSVAGVELAFNARVNWLTRTVSARSLFFHGWDRNTGERGSEAVLPLFRTERERIGGRR